MHKHIHVTCFGKIDKFASEFEVDMRAYTRRLSNKVVFSAAADFAGLARSKARRELDHTIEITELPFITLLAEALAT